MYMADTNPTQRELYSIGSCWGSCWVKGGPALGQGGLRVGSASDFKCQYVGIGNVKLLRWGSTGWSNDGKNNTDRELGPG